MDGFESLEKIGEGTYGVVYKAQVKGTTQNVALKKFRLDTQGDIFYCSACEGVPSESVF